MAKVSAKLGKTEYEMEDSTTPGIVRITRINSDGRKEFFIPSDLIVDYVGAKSDGIFATLLKKAMK